MLRYYKGGQDNFFYLGEINCRFVREFLRNETIPVTTSDLGRDYGKIVHFRSTDFSAYLNIISHSQDIQVVNSEYKYWQQNIHKHEHEHEKDEIRIW